MQRSPVVQSPAHGGVAPVLVTQGPVVHEQRAGESQGDDEAIVRREVENHQLGAPPASEDGGARGTLRQRAGACDAQHVALGYLHRLDPAAANALVKVAGDRLDFRELGHIARAG